MAFSPKLLKTVRLTHLYLGVFAAPAILFFAFTGAIQTFSLHESSRGSSYQPPRILVILAQIHKKQTALLPARKPPAREGSTASPDRLPERRTTVPEPEPAKVSHDAPKSRTASSERHTRLPLKIFFLLVSLILFISTASGIYMAYKYNRSKIAIAALLVLGTLVPILLIVL